MERRNTLPVLYTSGTYYEVGYDVGRTFRSLIEDFLASIKEVHSSLLKQFGTGEGKVIYDTTVASLKENFPHYIRELQGTADGARVPFEHLMVLHIIPRRSKGAQDLANVSAKGESAKELTLGCSSISINQENEVLLGHTEDAMTEMLNHIYLVDANITEREPQGKWGVCQEKFTALCYAGHLPGFCMGFNQHGLVYSINVITPLHIHSGKTPRHFLCRALLAAEDMPMFHKILIDEGVGAADGFGVNADFINEKGEHTFHNLEVGPVARSGNKSQLSVQVLNTGDHLLHTNKYLHLKIPEHQSLPWESSCIRHARAEDLSPPTSLEKLIAILSDEHHPEHPIYRRDDPLFITTALGVFDMIKKTWTFWIKNPKDAGPLFVFPMSFKWDS